MTVRFLDVHCEYDFSQLDEPAETLRKISDRLQSLTDPLRLRLRKHLRQNNYHLNEFRALWLQATPEPAPVQQETWKHWNGGGLIQYINVVLPVDEMMALSDPVEAGERIIQLYDDGLNQIRSRNGVPRDFLMDVLAEHSADGCVTTLEDKAISFPAHKLKTRLVSELTGVETRTYLCVRRMRQKLEDRVHVGTIDKSSCHGMFQDYSFDGTAFHLPQWLRQPHWPVSFVRTSVQLDEFEI